MKFKIIAGACLLAVLFVLFVATNTEQPITATAPPDNGALKSLTIP